MQEVSAHQRQLCYRIYRSSVPSPSSYIFPRLIRECVSGAISKLSRDSRWSALYHGRSRGHRPWTSRVQLLTTMYPRLLCAGRRSSCEGENGVTRAYRLRVSLQRPRSFNRTEGESNALFCLLPSVAVIRDWCKGVLNYLNKFLSLQQLSVRKYVAILHEKFTISLYPKERILDETYYFEVFGAFVNLRHFLIW